MERLKSAAVALALLCVSVLASAHGGGLNAEGCHTNRKTGDYHCHRAPAVLPVQKATAQQALDAPPSVSVTAPSRAAGATCYTGPRGGTYTLTASGKKNYGGC
ncbi:YHYH domain-containing protein [Paucibacter sp. PLA-PC-4]|uniref:YHYH domain-containing protein n=1 Tax=Paucibacter sp. PLA-PC-4 TaxID=2993655 RepID=UPI003A4C5C5B